VPDIRWSSGFALIQRQCQCVERLGRLDAHICHFGIKARNSGTDKHEGAELLTRISQIITNSNALKVLWILAQD